MSINCIFMTASFLSLRDAVLQALHLAGDKKPAITNLIVGRRRCKGKRHKDQRTGGLEIPGTPTRKIATLTVQPVRHLEIETRTEGRLQLSREMRAHSCIRFAPAS